MARIVLLRGSSSLLTMGEILQHAFGMGRALLPARQRLVTVTFAMVSAVAASAAHATVYGNAYDGYITGYFGSGYIPAFGESFTAPGGTLESWTFTAYSGNSGNVDLIIRSWNGSAAVGPALYTGAAQAYGGGQQSFTWSGIDLDLAGGNQYIAYLSTTGVTNPVSLVLLEDGGSDGGLGRGLVYGDGATSWISYYPYYLFYSADFGPVSVPEPASLALFGTGLAGLVVMRRRCRPRA